MTVKARRWMLGIGAALLVGGGLAVWQSSIPAQRSPEELSEVIRATRARRLELSGIHNGLMFDIVFKEQEWKELQAEASERTERGELPERNGGRPPIQDVGDELYRLEGELSIVDAQSARLDNELGQLDAELRGERRTTDHRMGRMHVVSILGMVAGAGLIGFAILPLRKGGER